MVNYSLSRRHFMTGASAYGVFLPYVRVRAEDTTLRVRENIQDFSRNADKVNALRLAVKFMKGNSAKNKHDPFGWYYWSAVHGTDDVVPTNLEPIYNQCIHTPDLEHVEKHFLSWHRAFLFYFETILKRAAQEAKASTQIELPYWNWYADPMLPEIFTEGDGNSNPLWHPRANEDLTGVSLFKRTFTFNDLLSESGIPAVKTFSYGFERNPHNRVHGVVGGTETDMGEVGKSARDPIFWLHHANIDRLWTAWMRGGSRVIPAADSQWGQTAWQFDEAGEWRQTAGAMLDSTKSPLFYRYDDETMPMVEVLVATAPQPTKIIEAQPSSANFDRLKNLQGLTVPVSQSAIISSTSKAVKLGNEAVAVDLKLPDQEATQLRNWATGETSDIKSASLVLEDINVGSGGKGGFSYAIVVSLPHAESKLPPVVVGELDSFTLSVARRKHAGKQILVFPLSEILPAWENISQEALKAGLRVTFEPGNPPKAGLVAPDLIEIGAVKLDISTLPAK